MDIAERIREIEEELRRTPYNKATQHHIGRLKAKLARLRQEAEQRRGGGGRGYAVPKEGDATVVLAGFPSVGKSTLLNALTNAESQVAEYAFTTLEVVPGMLHYNGARIQLLDVPGIIEGASRGRGRGREVLSVMRSADLVLLVLDAGDAPRQREAVLRELHEAGIRVNLSPPKVRIVKKERGGIRVSSTVRLSELTEETVKAVLAEYRIHNAEVVIHEDLTLDRLIDALAGNRVYVKALTVVNKADTLSEAEAERVLQELGDALLVSAKQGAGLEELKQRIYSELGLMRVYLKPPGREADLEEPMILPPGSTVRTVCSRLHKDFLRKFRYARVWGKSVRFPGQKVGLEHELADGDVLSISLDR